MERRRCEVGRRTVLARFVTSLLAADTKMIRYKKDEDVHAVFRSLLTVERDVRSNTGSILITLLIVFHLILITNLWYIRYGRQNKQRGSGDCEAMPMSRSKSMSSLCENNPS